MYKAKYTKTKEQKDELFKFYKSQKAYQHSVEMIKASNEYLSVLTTQLEHEKILKDQAYQTNTLSYCDYESSRQISVLNSQKAIIKQLERDVDLLKIQCSMQQKLI